MKIIQLMRILLLSILLNCILFFFLNSYAVLHVVNFATLTVRMRKLGTFQNVCQQLGLPNLSHLSVCWLSTLRRKKEKATSWLIPVEQLQNLVEKCILFSKTELLSADVEIRTG